MKYFALILGLFTGAATAAPTWNWHEQEMKRLTAECTLREDINYFYFPDPHVIAALCRKPPGVLALGCFIRFNRAMRFGDGLHTFPDQIILLRPIKGPGDPNCAVLAHEHRHADGWRHGEDR